MPAAIAAMEIGVQDLHRATPVQALDGPVPAAGIRAYRHARFGSQGA
jgi:hypothetical protein